MNPYNFPTSSATQDGFAAAGSSGGGSGGGSTPIIYSEIYRVNSSGNWNWADNTPLPFNIVASDSTGMWSSGNPARLTVTTAGVYAVNLQCSVYWTAGLGVVILGIIKNGDTNSYILAKELAATATNDFTAFDLTGVLNLAVNDYIEVCGHTFSGNTQLLLPPINSQQAILFVQRGQPFAWFAWRPHREAVEVGVLL